MNKLVRLLAVCSIAVLPTAAVAGLLNTDQALKVSPDVALSPQLKVGYVDVRSIAIECEAGKAAAAELKKKSEALQAKIKEKEKQLEKLKTGLEAKAATMPQEKRAAAAKNFQKKIDDFRDFVRKSEKEMQAKEEELTLKILDKIDAVVREYGKKNGYGVIAAKKEIMYADPAVPSKDLTPEILPLVDAKP